MIAVIFEAWPRENKWDDYLAMAARLKDHLGNTEGFISIERFQSIAEPGKVLSLSFWKDEQSVAQWRNMELHRAVQQEGRRSVFRDYRLRIATVARDYGMTDREQAPADSRRVHDE